MSTDLLYEFIWIPFLGKSYASSDIALQTFINRANEAFPPRRFLYIALHSRILHCAGGRLGRLCHFRGVGFAFGIPKYRIYYVPISYIFLPSARLASSSALGFT
jgi:hypothetical protein